MYMCFCVRSKPSIEENDKRKRMEGNDRNTERMTANLTRIGTKLFEQEGDNDYDTN